MTPGPLREKHKYEAGIVLILKTARKVLSYKNQSFKESSLLTRLSRYGRAIPIFCNRDTYNWTPTKRG